MWIPEVWNQFTMQFLIVLEIIQIKFWVQTKTYWIGYSYCRRKRSGLLVLNVEIAVLILFSHEMIKHSDKVVIENCLFISKSISFALLLIFNYWFLFSWDSHNCETFCLSKGFLNVSISNIKRPFRKALINRAISSRNDIRKFFSCKMLGDIPSFKLKKLPAKHFLETHNNHNVVFYLSAIFILLECNLYQITFFRFYL